MAHNNFCEVDQSMSDDELPATQCVLPLLFGDVVAYVEVRSGHDNCSKGVMNELRRLGAKIVTVLGGNVTHVVFQGGHVSIYKKARQLMCHVVAVSWIEASKELGYKAPEDDHPPPGYEKYEDPDAARKIKVLKSMQPDEEKDEERLNAILARIKKRNIKKRETTSSDLSNVSDKPSRKLSEKRKKDSSLTTLSKSPESYAEETLNNTKTGQAKKRSSPTSSKTSGKVAPKKTRKSSLRNTNEVSPASRRGSPKSSASSSIPQNPQNARNDGKKVKSPKSHTLPLSEDHDRTFQFVIPQLLRKRRGSCSSTRSSTIDSSSVSAIDNKPASSRALVFIENVQKEKDGTNQANRKVDTNVKSPSQHLTERQTRRRSGLAGVNLIQPFANLTKNKTKEPTEEVPFISKVLETLASKKKPQEYVKSPWRRKQSPTATRRQSPRIRARKGNAASSDQSDTDSENSRRSNKEVPLRRKNVPRIDASAHLYQLWKAKSSIVGSPKLCSLDTTYSPDEIAGCTNIAAQCNSDARPGCSLSPRKTPLLGLNPTKDEDQAEQNGGKSLESIQGELLDLERSSSPILGTRLKHRKADLTNSFRTTQDLRGVTRLSSTTVPSTSADIQDKTRSLDMATVFNKGNEVKSAKRTMNTESRRDVEEKGSCATMTRKEGETDENTTKNISMCLSEAFDDISTRVETAKTTANRKSRKRVNELDRLPSSLVNTNETVHNTSSDSSLLSTRPTRRRSLPGRNEKPPTLVCTHLNGMDVKKVMKAVRNLGKFEFEENVSGRTTHLVASGPRRTINMLRGICRGCWIVRDEWIYQSVKAGRWLPEEQFELTEFSPMVQQRRLLRQSASGLSQWNLLSSVGPIAVSPASSPSPPDLKDLINLCGGSVVKSVDAAAFILGPPTKSSNSKDVKLRVAPVWVLDCIVKGELIPFSASEYTGNI